MKDEAKRPKQTTLRQFFWATTACCALAGIFGCVQQQIGTKFAASIENSMVGLFAVIFAVAIGVLKDGDFIWMNLAFLFALAAYLFAFSVF